MNAFKNDIIKSTNDMLAVLKNMSDKEKMQVIEPYYKALKKSKFKELDILFDGIKTVLKNEQWQEIKKDEDEKQEGGE